jgi:hypothetical protein
VKLAVAPDGLHESIKVFFINKGEIPSLDSLRVYSYPNDDNAFFVTFSSDKTDGWFLFAERKYKDNQVYWQLTIPTREQIENFSN